MRSLNKTGGLLGVNYTTWDAGRDGAAKGGPVLGDHSFLYNDRPSSRLRGGTGFNHAEMIYSERRYDSSDDPGLPDGAFDKGDRNPPTRDAEDWVQNNVFGAN